MNISINYDVTIPKSDAEDLNALYTFAESGKKTMEIIYENSNEATLRRSVLARAIENNDLNMDIKRMSKIVYISKR